MEIEAFKRKADILISQLQDLINQVPQKGNTSEECQYMTLQIELNGFEYAINGTNQKDLKEDDE